MSNAPTTAADAPCKRCGQEPYPEATRECIKRGTGECELAQRTTPPAERPTPETDKVLRRNAESDQTPEEDYEVLGDHAANLEYRLSEAIEQRDSLQRWKDEMMTVQSWWQKIDDAVRAHPDAIIGQVVADTALGFIRERDALAAAFSEWPRLREWMEMDSFIRGYMSAELAAFDAMSEALAATKGGQS